MKKAVLIGNKIIVSPAMHDLIKNADPKELEHLLKNIPLINIPEIPSIEEMSQQMFYCGES